MKIKKHEDYETIEVEYAEARDSQTIFLAWYGPYGYKDGGNDTMKI